MVSDPIAHLGQLLILISIYGRGVSGSFTLFVSILGVLLTYLLENLKSIGFKLNSGKVSQHIIHLDKSVILVG